MGVGWAYDNDFSDIKSIFIDKFVFTAASDTTQDEICTCFCSRCICIFFELTGTLLAVLLLRFVISGCANGGFWLFLFNGYINYELGAGSGQCGALDYDTVISTGKKRSAAEIKAFRLKQKNFNKGDGRTDGGIVSKWECEWMSE